MLIMNNNSLSGSINLNCSAMKNLTSLGLGSNQFHVPISRNLSGCLRLEAINLARNHLNAGVPVTLKNLQSLTQLSVSNSSLHNLSATLEVLGHCKLKYSSRHNQSKGSIPKWLSRRKKLQMLDLSWNHLSGSIPSWFGKFDNLFYLDLSNNSFTGNNHRV
ncbi:hypothetical protein JHK87_044187 [Glycine soja]|nr:hypothetical protein JHK87_044187 [Glycine soja]